MLDNVIELNFYTVEKVKNTNLQTRAVGLGAMGEAEMLAKKGIVWGSERHFAFIDEIFEMISYNAIKTSSDLAIEKGKYPQFEGSNWAKGILPIDHASEEAKKLSGRGLFDEAYDWNALREKVKRDGMRNGYLMAVAPTSSISILVGTTQTIEPIYKRKWFEENLSGLIPVVVPGLTIDTYEYYKSAYDIDQMLLIQAAAVRQKWIDQGQSLNIFMKLENASGKVLNDIYMLAWKLGLKSTYYLRSQSPDNNIEEDTMDRSIECEGCQ
jgi:ribonucleoside-diphosphate reductase alpha chain